MKATIVISLLGVLGFGEDGKIIGKRIFSRDPVKIAEKLFETESGRATSEVTDLVKELTGEGYQVFGLENSILAQTLRRELGVEIEVETPSALGETLRSRMGDFAVQVGLVKDPSDVARLVHGVSMELAQTKVKKATEKRDLLIVQAIQAADDLDRTLNLFMSRIREWYGLHFPELDRLLDKHETYARLVQKIGNKSNFSPEELEKEGLSKNKALQVADIAKASMGPDLNDADVEPIQAMCSETLQLYEARSKLEKYIDDMMAEVAPNTRAIISSSLGARLIALAGGLSNLAKMPASTVQVLGAEKALFRSLTTGARPPKHGMIFQHNLIHGAKGWQRGKISRALAGKLAIAIRIDAFSGTYIGDRLREELQERINEIEKKYAQPKPRPAEKKQKKSKKSFKGFRENKRWKSYGRKG